MAIVNTDWEQYRAANSSIPPDIFFKVLESTNNEENIEMEAEDDKINLIGAHKLLLAGTSPVFRANFFGLLKMTGEVMVVKETTQEAFMTLINFIYWPPGKATFSLSHIASLEDLCDIIEISERYQILDLVQVAKKAIQALEITKKNVIISATVADKFKHFDGVQEMLFHKILNFLEKTTTAASDVISLMVETNNDHPENGLKVLINLLKMKEEQTGGINKWGAETIIFSKSEEHKITAGSTLTTLPKLEKQWRITHEFKPMTYKSGNACSLRLMEGTQAVISFWFSATSTTIYFANRREKNIAIKAVPKIGEWTTIDVTNEELEPGKYTFTVFIGGVQVFKDQQVAVGPTEFFNVCVTEAFDQLQAQDGHIRGLTIMTKK